MIKVRGAANSRIITESFASKGIGLPGPGFAA